MATQVIVLNGGSSSGKSGIARCLQAVLPDPWLAFGTDTLVQAMPLSMQTSAAGIEFAKDGEVIVGPEFRRLEAAWIAGVAAMAQAGARIIVDEVFVAAMSPAIPYRPSAMEAINLADLYQLPLLEWASIENKLRAGVDQAPGAGGPNRHTCWLSTINADGSPHVNGVGALWADGCFWFETGQGSRKGRNLARDPRCAMSLATEEFDLVVEGEASLVTDPATVADMAARWATGGWPARVDDTGVALTAEFSAPSAGPPPWHVYRLTPKTATALATVEPGGATRWRF